MDSQRLSLILNAVLVIVIIVLVVFGLQKGNFDGVDAKTLQSEYIDIETYNTKEREAGKFRSQTYEKDREISDLKRKNRDLREKVSGDFECPQIDETSKKCTFDDLDAQEQERYVLQTDITEKTEALKNQIRQLKKQVQTQETNSGDKAVESKSTKAQPKKPKQTKSLQATTGDANQTLTCNDYGLGSYYINKACEKKILDFVQQYKSGYAFHVIGVVDNHDFAVITGLKKADDAILKKLDIQDHHIKQLESIASLGLARARAKEVMQLLKYKLGKDVAVSQASYELVLKDKRGFVLQALPLQ